ncbi:putative TFIIIC transcription initiation factor complex subunits Tfc3 [Aspergillus glaucus CBS 516.65]|uniref:Uncharacterized protein n=1 Tax=Aspergillus glaucus CBS 516.65 TaxID=1160497 RepID=A0A1L9VX62_ASPGL|nr:hypothetical protein ASPGLDRAFT_22010 [Aspergillus glaucus CBS 516.65]OJJ88485.1 hypothetical protein ASPGLDRAFT_22010 [Aspergillus glaucus CBS 516.65]
MAPSLQELIDYLLAEIALCGDQGASLPDILNFTTAFYAKEAQDASHKTHTVDRRFQAKVWSWLTRHPEVSVGKNREGNHLTFDDAERLTQNADADGTKDDVPRVFVTEERTWLAVAGHEPDETKILPTEFALLSIIASSNSSGVVQTELVRLSGQDKRSVPKRTDRLQTKGYIQKRPFQFKSIRTSLCILPKFSKTEYMAEAPTNRGAEATDRVIDFDVFTDKLFEILKQHGIIAREDLKRILGFSDRWRWKVLSRALRKFERIGVLKRVKAMSQYKDTMNNSYPCVKLLREPSEKDLELFHLFSRNLMGQKEEDVDEPDDDLEEETGRNSTSEGTLGMIKREDNVEESGRVLPIWTPDRNLHHMIFNVIDAAGANGINNYGIVRICFGGFFRRPLENALGRLVECWQLSQPAHLRHLAIVRDTVLHRTQAMYLYYSATTYRNLVEAGDAVWEAVEYSSKNTNGRIPPIDVVPRLDEYGFPLKGPSKELLKKGNASLLECMAVGKPEDYNRSFSDPVAVQLEDGSYAFQIGTQKRPANVPPEGDSRPSAPRGRPKKEPKQEIQEDVNMDTVRADNENAEVEVVQPKRPKRPRTKTDRFKGMSEKEKLEALGMDETWTEYNILLMERPNPGVYATPRGRRRPVGKARGRPRTSQLVVFKSSKLMSFPWFVEEAEAEAVAVAVEENGENAVPETPSTETPIATPVINEPAIEDSATPTAASRGVKRTFQEGQPVDGEPSPVTATRRGRPPKQRRKNHVEDTGMQDAPVSTPENQPAPNNHDIDTAEHPTKRKRLPSSAEPERGAMEVQEPSRSAENETSRRQPKRPRHDNEPVSQNGTVSAAPIPETPQPSSQLEPPSGGEKGPEERQALANEAQLEGAMVADHDEPSIVDQPHDAADTTAEPARKKRNKKGRTDTGGSVAVLRKKILTEIVDKAGGAYPMGSELWYPFATAWMKTKYREKPDMRTLRTSVKHLVDAGKLRQLTFSGRDDKGVMITKSIITKPELPPGHRTVRDMQQKMLSAGTRFYFPPNSEIHPDIIKGSNGLIKREHRPITQIPVETGLTVQLQQKPSYVLARERKIQRQFWEMFENEFVETNEPRAGRLMTIRRPGHGPNNMTSIARPGSMVIGEGILRKAGEIKRLRTAVSCLPPYAIFMNATQTFHAASGTFGTDSGIAARRPALRKKPPLPHIHYTMFMNPKQVFNAATGTFGTHAAAAPRRGRRMYDPPDTLDALLTQREPHVMETAETTDPTDQFFKENDDLLRWELENEDLFNEKRDRLEYINQTVPGSFDNKPIRRNIRFDADRRAERTVPRESEPMTTRQATRQVTKPPTKPPTRQPTRQATRAPPERRLEKLNDLSTPGSHKASPKQPIRRNRIVHTLPQDFVQRMIASIVAVRVLAGGLEAKNVDWPLVAKCFPKHEGQFIHERGKSILSRNRLQVAKMQSDFQERFIEAYANDKVPQIDYENLDGYDWVGVVDWAQAQLDIPSTEKLPNLPATKAQFDGVFELREEPSPSLDEVYHGTNSVTLNRKRTLIAGVPFAEPLRPKHKHKYPTTPSQRKANLDRLEVAKTWIRANIVTPQESYNATQARKSLERFGEPLIQNAIQALMTERVIMMGNGGRVTPGRNYDITEVFVTTLRRRAIESSQLRRAAEFKSTVLDPALREQGSLEVDYTADDGDILALINLAAHRKIILKPRNPPREKFGLTDGGYLTRLIDKQKMRFSIQITPVKENYPFGNPIESQLSSTFPPTLPISPSDKIPKIPVWLDIHGNFFKLLWDLVAGAVVGCVATRPGISAAGVASMMRPTVGAWEVQVMLEWLEGVGIVARPGRGGGGGGGGVYRGERHEQPGWVVGEWWWMVTES